MATLHIEVSLKAFTTDGKKIFKVTRRVPSLLIADTKFFTSKEEARRQLLEWL